MPGNEKAYGIQLISPRKVDGWVNSPDDELCNRKKDEFYVNKTHDLSLAFADGFVRVGNQNWYPIEKQKTRFRSLSALTYPHALAIAMPTKPTEDLINEIKEKVIFLNSYAPGRPVVFVELDLGYVPNSSGHNADASENFKGMVEANYGAHLSKATKISYVKANPRAEHGADALHKTLQREIKKAQQNGMQQEETPTENPLRVALNRLSEAITNLRDTLVNAVKRAFR